MAMRTMRTMRTMRVCLPLLLLLFLRPRARAASAAPPAATYDAACDAIVEAAQQAARAQRAGNQQGADRWVAQALSRFESAKALAPSEPQAYMHAATFLMNIHRFDAALEVWDQVAVRGDFFLIFFLPLIFR